ncbi:MAG: HD domain-containing protein [Lachnospiraceae bacterium]|nr:HD domain-containing protein [Lachnospiraceae bacterium]
MNREQAIGVFKEYTDHYDSKDTKVWLKIEHSYRVCDIALQIASSVFSDDKDIELAWIMGLLHDIGRFEQLRRYGTFLDAHSIDHAELGADILFKDGIIDRFNTDGLPDDWMILTEKAIRLHNKLNLPGDLTVREKLFCDILRDADKVDIFRVLAEIPYEKRANYENPPKRECARDEVMICVKEHRCVPRVFERSRFEAQISQCCMAFELVYDESRKLVVMQGNLMKLIEEAKKDANDKEFEQMCFLEDELKKYFKG